MSWSKWFKWFGVYLAIAGLLAAAGWGIHWATGFSPLAEGGGRMAVGFICVLLTAWSVRGLVLLARGEADRLSRFIQLSITTFLILPGIGGVYLALTGKLASESDFGKAVAAIWGLSWLFIVLIELLRLALGRGGRVLGVARTVVDEAIRMKAAVTLIAILMGVLPILPFVLYDDAPLRYRVQMFLTYSLAAVTLLLSLMTILLACATLSWEIEGKQIFTVATKPIGRGTHLLGKWVGIMSLNAVLVVIAGAAIYGFTAFYLARQPAQDAYDALKLDQEVLTARVAVTAQPPRTFDEMAEQQLAKIVEEDPQRLETRGREAALGLGIVEPSRERLMQLGQANLYNELREEVEKNWRVIHPGRIGVYVFEGLTGAKEYARRYAEKKNRRALLQFSYKVDTSTNVEDNQILVVARFNGQPVQGQPLKFVTNSAQIVQVDPELIDDAGRLKLEIANVNPADPYERRAASLTFSSRDKMQILYHKGDFGPNFLRGMIALWVKLGFLAMLGLAAATFLGFPVAAVLSLLVATAAMFSPYLLDSVRSFGNNPQNFAEYIAMILKWIGWATATLLQQFAAYTPNPLIVDGREFSWQQLARCIVWVGIVWTALTGFIGYAIYRNRELARVQV